MSLFASVIMEREGIEYLEVRARHREGPMHIEEFIAKTPEDLAKFRVWADANGVTFDEACARVATPEEIKANEEVPW